MIIRHCFGIVSMDSQTSDNNNPVVSQDSISESMSTSKLPFLHTVCLVRK